MADFNTTSAGDGDASGFEAAAKAKLDEAKNASAGIQKATTATREVRLELEDAEGALRDLEREAERAEKVRKKLSDKQRDLLDRIARSRKPTVHGGGRGGGVAQTQASLERRGLIEFQPEPGTNNHGGYVLTEQGRGHDLEGIQGDIIKQRQYIDRLNDQAAKDVQSAVRQDVKTAETQASNARQVKQKAAARKPAKPKVPPLRELSAGEQTLMAEYIGASQKLGQGSSDEERKAVAELRKKLQGAGVLGVDPIGNYGKIPQATTPALGTKAWQGELEKAKKAPGFSFTPDPARLAREMARVAGDVEFFPDEQKEFSQLKGTRTTSKKQAQTAWTKWQGQIQDALRPQAVSALEALPPASAKKISAAVEQIRKAQGYAATEAAETALLNTAQKAQQVAATAAPKPKITYASPAVEKQIAAENAARAAKVTDAQREQAREMGRADRGQAAHALTGDTSAARNQMRGVAERVFGPAPPEHVIDELGDAYWEGVGSRGAKAMREAGAGQYDRPIGPAQQVAPAAAQREADALRRYEVAKAEGDAALERRGKAKYGTESYEREEIARSRAQIVADAAKKDLAQARAELGSLFSPEMIPGNAKRPFGLGLDLPGQLGFRGNDPVARRRFASREAAQKAAEKLNAATAAGDPSHIQSFQNPVAFEQALNRREAELNQRGAGFNQYEKPIGPQRPAAGARTADFNLPEGDAEAFEREARKYVRAMTDALDPEGKRRLAERVAPVTDPAEQKRVATEVEAKAAQPKAKPFTPLKPRASAGGNARAVQEHIARLEEEAARQEAAEKDKFDQKVAREQEKRDEARRVRAEARRRDLIQQSRAGADPKYTVPGGGPLGPPPPPSPPPPAPPTPPDDPNERRPLYQRLADAMAKRAAEQEQMARLAEQEKFDQQVAREQEKREQSRRVRAEAKRRELIEQSRAGVDPKYTVPGGGPIGPPPPPPREYQQLTDLLARRQAEMEAGARAAAGPLPNGQLIPQRQVPAFVQRPQRIDRRALGVVERDIARAEAATEKASKAEEEYQRRLADTTRWQQEYSHAVDGSTDSQRRWAAQVGYSSQAMRRHGTFTTEFISAAAKGEVAYREWGWQIGAAAAKFGAWTAAGAGIYAAIGAVGAIGQGAVQSASGVEALKRTMSNVNSGQAQQSFREQAAHFNVPIETVVDAQMRMGAVFHDQADAATAANAALYALKTGQVDVAQSTKDLIAIQQAYGASASDLVNLFDELNYVQNNYGARIPDMETGLAAAAGSFKQMGGSMEDAVALFTTLQRFGTTGNITSTIVRRMPNELAKPGNQAVLGQYGIDPKADVMTILRQAQEAVTSGADPQTVAKALVGGQFAGRFQNVLTHPGLMAKILNELVSGKAAGASETELGHVLREFTEQAKAIGIELGNLGSNLAQSGLVTVLGTGVVALREMLSLTNSLLGVFNKMPGPIKTVAAYAAVAAVALAGARRLGLGGALVGKGALADRVAPYLVEDEATMGMRVGRKGINDAVKAATDEQERAHAAALRTAHDLEYTTAHTKRVIEETAPGVEANDEQALARRERAIARHTRAIDAHEAAELRGELATERLTRTLDDKRVVEGAAREAPRGRARKEAYLGAAIDSGIYVPPSYRMDVPGNELVQRATRPGVIHVDTSRVKPTAGTSYAPPISPAVAAATADAEAAAAASIGKTTPPRSKRILVDLGAAMQRQGSEFREHASLNGRVAAAGKIGASAASAAATGAKSAARGLASMGARVGAMLGPEGLIIAAIAMLPAVFEAVQERDKQLDDMVKPLPIGSLTVGDADAKIRAIELQRKAAEGLVPTLKRSFVDPLVELYRLGDSIAGLVSETVTGVGGALKDLSGATIGRGLKGVGIGDSGKPKGPPGKPGLVSRFFGELLAQRPDDSLGDTIRRRLKYPNPLTYISDLSQGTAESGQDERAKADRIRAAAIERAHKAGRPASGLTGDEIGQLARADVDQLKSGAIDQREFDKRRALRLQELTMALENGKSLSKARREYLLQRIKEVMNQPLEDLKASIDAQYDLLISQTDDPIKQAQLKAEGARKKLAEAQKGGKPDAIAEAQAEVNNTQRAAEEAVKQQAQAQLDALGALVNQGDVGPAGVRGYISKLQTEMAKLQGSDKPEDIQRYVALRGQLIDTLTNIGKADLTTSLTLARSQTAVDRAYRKSDEQFDAAAKTANKSGDKKLARQIRAMRTQRGLEELQGRGDYMDAKAAVEEGKGPAGLPRLKAELAEIGKKVQLALKLHLRGTKEFMQLITEQQQAESAVVEEQLSLMQAKAGAAAAGITDPVAAGQMNLASLQQQLAYMRANRRTYGDDDTSTQIQNMIGQVKQAKADLAEQASQQARDLIDAQYQLIESRNDDPVFRARKEAERTATIVQRGGFRSPADRIRAQADANNAKRDAQDAAVHAQMENIDYDVEIGKITTEQQIAKYEELLKTSKMGQTARKDLVRQIGRLKHQAETGSEGFSLDVGNIRLPSVYEVHRAIREGHDARNRTVVNNSPTVNVNLAPGDDGSAVVRNLDRYLHTSARSAMRASADIGV